MKSHTLLVLVATLFAFGAVGTELPATADEASPADEAPAMSASESVGPANLLDALGMPDPLFQQIQECRHPNPGIDCSQWDSASCTYGWDCECCCAPTYTAPGAYCPKYCV